MLKQKALSIAVSVVMLNSAYISMASAGTNQIPSMEKMWEMIQLQQRQIDALKRENKQLSGQVEVASEMAEKASTTAVSKDGDSDVSIGGYGELHYNNLDSKNEVDFG